MIAFDRLRDLLLSADRTHQQQGIELLRALAAPDLAALDLSRADLRALSFAQMSLVGVSFRDSLLQEMDLQRADLRNADFENANLMLADLRGANLQGARFNQAICYGAQMDHTPPGARRTPALTPGFGLRWSDRRGLHCVALEVPRLFLGRHPTGGLKIDDYSVSRHQCLLDHRGRGGLWVMDTISASGTYVNGEQIIEHRLFPGDKLVIGRTSIDVLSLSP